MRCTAFVLVGLFIAPALAAEPDAAPAPPLRQQVADLLARGFESEPSALRNAETARQAAQRLAPGDPRLDMAWGLVLLKQHRHREAAEQFEQATKRPGPPCWPAWQALIWCRFAAKNYSAGLSTLAEFATRWSKSADPAQRRVLAEWTGGVVQAVEQTTSSTARAETLASLDTRLRAALDADLISAYEQGRDRVRAERQWLLGEIAEARQTATEQQTQRRAAAQEQIASERDAISEEREKVGDAAADLRESATELSRDYAAEEATNRQQAAYLLNRSLSLQLSATKLQSEMQTLQSIPLGKGRPQARAYLAGVEQQQASRLGVYEFESLATTGQLLQTQQQAQALRAREQADAARVGTAASELARRDALLRQRATRLERQEARLTAQPLGHSPQVRALEVRARTLMTYFDFNLDTERMRLLDSFSP